MNTIDTMLLAAGALSANATTVDHVINAGLVYGPGVLLTTAVVCAIRICRWAADRYQQWIDIRATQRWYTARAARLNTVADNTDQIIAAAGNQLADQLLHHLRANDLEEEK